MTSTDSLFEQFSEELRSIARRVMARASPASTLQATVLVNEAYLRFKRAGSIPLSDERHFVCLASRIMRYIQVEHDRRKLRRLRLDLDGQHLVDPDQGKVLRIDSVLRELQAEDAEAAAVAEMRYFAGLSVQQVAKTLHMSASSVKRRSAMARSFIEGALRERA